MKSAHVLLASLLALSLGMPHVHAQTTPFNGSTPNINPVPGPCCACISMDINNLNFGNDGRLQPTTDGNYEATVTVRGGSSSPCNPDGNGFTVIADLLRNGDPIYTEAQGGLAPPDQVLGFALSVNRAHYGDEWRFRLYCGEGKHCQEITLKLGGCKSCSEICKYSGTPEATNGAPTNQIPTNSTGGFSVAIPTTQSNGGNTDGALNFYAKDFANPGRAALLTSMPSDITVIRDSNGLVTSIQTGANTLEVTAADSALLALDPNAFTVTHKDPAGTPFRTTTISFVTDAGVSRLRMDTTFEGSITRNEQTQPVPGTFVMEKGRLVAGSFESLSQETFIKNESLPGTRIHRRISKERATAASAWTTSSETESTWEKQIYQWVQTKKIIDPDGQALTSTWSYYQPGDITGPGGSTEGLGRLKQYISYDGSESFHTYSLNQSKVITPYAGDPAGKTTTQTWDPGTQTMTETTTVNGNTISKSSTTLTATSGTRTVYTSDGQALSTVTHYMPSGQDFGGKPARVISPDGTITTYAYTRNAGGGFTTVTESGSSTNGTTVTKGTRSITTTNSRGTTILTNSEAIGYGTGSAVFGFMAVTSIDNLGRALTTAHHPASATVTGEVASATSPAWTTTTEYSCCGVAKETDMYGIPTFHAYDHLQRQIKTNTLGVTSETIRNGLTTETHRYPETVTASLSPAFAGTPATLVSKSISNLTGTLQESWSPDPTSSTPGALVKSSTTATTYKPAAGLSTRTVTTTPDNFTQTTDSFLDGKSAATYGDLSPAISYSYSVNATGEVNSQSLVDGASLRETTTSQSDWAGRALSTTLMDGATSTMTYNSIGQMIKSTDPDGVTSLSAYNAEGERSISAIDLNANGQIDYGIDTVSASESDPSLDGSNNLVMVSTSKIWQPGDINPAGGTLVSTSTSSPNGLSSSSQSLGVANPSTSLTILGTNGNWTTTSTAPVGTKQVQTYTNGRMASTAHLDSNGATLQSQSQGYDSLNRPITQTDSRTGATTTTYLSTTSDIVTSVTDSGNRTTAFTYDIRGRQISVNAPDSLDADGNTLANVTTTLYNPDSTVAETTGDQTYRTTHTYDYADRQITLTTYGSEQATSYWHFSPTRGFLTRKAYQDGKGTDYTYTAAGRLSTRAWARGIGTVYTYDTGGRLISTTYSDDTPDVAITFDSLGRQLTQSNGLATSTYAYNPATLALDTETLAYNLDGQPGADFTRVIDRNQDTLQRDTGWQLKDGSIVENSASYAYGASDGRISSISNPQLSNVSYNYSYLPNSNLLATVASPVHTTTNTWEANRNVLTSKENKLGTTNISSYTYGVNHLGQRTQVSKTGTAFTSARDIAWGYNSKGEVVKAIHSADTAFNRAYQYDGIGNRLQSGAGVSPTVITDYTPNALNQYSSITNPQSTILNPVYDFDGNMTNGPLPAAPTANSTLVWDAENRLISTTAGTNTKTTLYDSQSRRISDTAGSNTTLYVYDGFNCIAEYTGTTLSKTRLWGVDLSGSMQGAGGVGGILAEKQGSNIYHPTYDGNGNVSEYLDSTGSIVAHYEYDPFGNTVVATGPKANDFAYRFATKPLDQTTGLYYYLYRWYDPLTGKWTSRDPIGEAGGFNLYGFVGNNGVGEIDVLGNVVWEHNGTPVIKDAYPFGLNNPIVGDVYEVKTDAGNKIQAWKGKGEFAGVYWCHGYTFDGSPHYSVIGPTVLQILKDDRWNHIPCTQATSDDIAVFGEGDDTQHSGKVEKVETVAILPHLPSISKYKFDESKSMLKSKWGNTPGAPQSDTFTVNIGQYKRKYKCYSKKESSPASCDGPGDNEIWKKEWIE